MPLMSKSEFARHIGRSPGRVTQMISEGTIGADALEGDGRNARIDVDKAMRQISLRIGTGRSVGSRLDLVAAAGGEADKLNHQIKVEQLETLQRRNRQAALDEYRGTGQLIHVDHMQQELRRSLQEVVAGYEGMISGMANALASRFGIPQRDAEFAIRKAMSDGRRAAADRARQASTAEALTTIVEMELGHDTASA